jgi:hypothetical protein
VNTNEGVKYIKEIMQGDNKTIKLYYCSKFYNQPNDKTTYNMITLGDKYTRKKEFGKLSSLLHATKISFGLSNAIDKHEFVC